MSVEMRKVVIAGGTGEVGRILVDAILATNKFSLIVFTRKDASDLSSKGVQVVSVDYSNHSFLVKSLQGIHTVISCISSYPNIDNVQSQLALLNASVEAGVKRFAPSEWVGNSQSNTVVQLYKVMKNPVLDAVKQSGIEYTVFMPGMFMDYLASPQQSNPYLKPFITPVDINNCRASFPGTGDEPITFTLAADVGKLVALSLDLEKWEPYSGMSGSQTSWNEIIRVIEQIRHKKFHVDLLKTEQLMDNEASNSTDNDDVMANFYNEFLLAILHGELNIQPTLNQIFPSAKLTNIREFLEQWWRDKPVFEPKH